VDETDSTMNKLIEVVDSNALIRRAVELPCMLGRSSMYVDC
jgi:hypothetical protein